MRTVSEAVCARLEGATVRNRLGLALGATALVALFGAGALGAAPPEKRTLEAQEFVLKDAEGRTRAVLGVLPDGAADLSLLDDAGKAKAWLRVTTEGAASLRLVDRNEKGGILLDFGRADTATLNFVDRTGRPRASMLLAPDGSPGLRLADEGGKALFEKP